MACGHSCFGSVKMSAGGLKPGRVESRKTTVFLSGIVAQPESFAEAGDEGGQAQDLAPNSFGAGMPQHIADCLPPEGTFYITLWQIACVSGLENH